MISLKYFKFRIKFWYGFIIYLFLLQACADSITSKAKKNQQNRRYLSPFAKNAQAQGINFMGGKEDDTTLLLASVSLIPDDEKAQEKDELWSLHTVMKT